MSEGENVEDSLAQGVEGSMVFDVSVGGIRGLADVVVYPGNHQIQTRFHSTGYVQRKD